MKKVALILFIVCLSLYSAQKWNCTFDFDSGSEFAKSVIQTSDSCYILTGGNDNETLTLKTDHNGNLLWNSNHFALMASGEEILEVDDGYLVCGWSKGLGGEWYALLNKYGFDGDTLLTSYYPNENPSFCDGCFSIVQTSDGGFALPVNIHDPYLFKLNESYEEQWVSPTYETFQNGAEGRSILQMDDFGYIVVGFEFEKYSLPDSSNVFIYKTDSLGNYEWSKTFGDSLNDDRAFKVLPTDNNSFLISGYTETYGAGGKDAWLIKTDSLGNEIWNKTYGGMSDDYCYSMSETQDGNYVLIGSTSSYGNGLQDVWLIKVDPEGNELWNETYGDSLDDVGYSVKPTFDGGYIITGYTNGAGGKDIWLIKTDENGVTSIDPDLSGIITNYDLKQNYPNPFNPTTTIRFNLKVKSNIKISVFNSKGELLLTLFEGTKDKGNHSINFDASYLNSGVYFYRLTSDGKAQTKKMLYLR